MASKIIKQVFHMFIVIFFSGVMPVKAVVKAEDIAENLIKKTMTSQIMEEYVRERLKFRIKYWQDQFKQWHKRWNIVTDEKFYKTFKMSSLSDKAFNELCKIPFYIFIMGNNEQWMKAIQQNGLSKVYVYSDSKAQELYKTWYKEELPEHIPGFTVINDSCTIFINDCISADVFQRESASYYMYSMFHTIEHELTHVEQKFEALVLGLCVGHNDIICKILNFVEKNPSWRRFTTRFTYDFFYLTEKIESEKIEILDYSFLSSHTFSQKVKYESEADKVALKFFEGPMEGYHAWNKFFGLNEQSNFFNKIGRYDKQGYSTKENKARLIIKRLMEEGHLKVDDFFKARFIKDEKVNFPRRKLIKLPTYFDFHNAGHLDEHGQFILRSKI